MMFPRSRFFSVAIFLALGLLATQAAWGLVIDDFSQGAMQITAFGGPSRIELTQPNLHPDHTIGGARHWSGFYHNAPSGLPDSYTSIRIDPVKETFEFQSVSDDCSSCGYFNLTYGSEELPLGLDLLADGADRFRFRFLGEGTSPWLFFRVWAPLISNNDIVTDVGLTIGVNNVIAPSDAIFEVPFDRFDLGGEPLLDLTQVERILIGIYRYPAGQRFELKSIETIGTPLAGDYDRDGDVDIEDYNRWASGRGELQRVLFSDGELIPYTSSYSGLSIDGNENGRIDAADYTVWRDAFENTGQVSVPEPGGLGLLLVAMSIMGVRCSRRASTRV